MKAMKILGKTAALGAAAYVGMFLVYWFNVENKLIFYVIRPLLNMLYDKKEKDVRI